jgi:transcriptional regulator with XRE-family HTH domain
MSAVLQATIDLDERRRERLKAFLVSCRSRLTPGDVGLPETQRRRVPGLKRDEVAELVGVSSDWYRWFESGRSIRVSVQFLAKLSKVLRLSPLEQIGLYHLAFPEVYEAYLAQRHITIPLLAFEERSLSITAA